MRDQTWFDARPDGSESEPFSIDWGSMYDHARITIADAEVLAVCGGIDDGTGQPVVVLTLRPITGTGWGHVNYSLHPENARSLLDRLSREFDTSPYLRSGSSGTTA